MIHHAELRTLADTLDFHEHRHGDRLAVVADTGARIPYAELARRSRALAAALRESGVQEGSRVAYLGREAPAYWETLFACVQLGAVLVPVNVKLAAVEVEHILTDSGAVAVLLDADHPLVGVTGLAEIVVDDGFESWRDRRRAQAPAVVVVPETAVAQLYTSGTTGLPKGVVLAHRSFFAIRDALASENLDWIDWDDGDVALIGIPGFHVGGLWFATQAFNAGATVVSMTGFSPALARRLLREEKVTSAIFVPAMLQSLLAEGTTPDDVAFLRKVVYGGAPIAQSVLERCVRVFGAGFAQIYGLTETGNTAICLPPDQHLPGATRLRAAGRPYPGVAVRILDEDGNEATLGETGEVYLRTPAVMLEYWRMPEATASTLIDGWIRTGDAGYLDAEGYLFIQDRVKDMIIVGGENVFPAEVENALLRHPAVADAAVIGIPDDLSGEAVLAYVTSVDGAALSTRDLTLFLRERLADFKLPSRYEFIDVVPRNPSGKILRRLLRDEHWRDRDRKIG